MMIPDFLRFYNYTNRQVLDEYAITFFSLANAMYRIIARESIATIMNFATANNGKDMSNYLNSLKKQERGLDGIVKETRIIKEVKRDVN